MLLLHAASVAHFHLHSSNGSSSLGHPSKHPNFSLSAKAPHRGLAVSFQLPSGRPWFLSNARDGLLLSHRCLKAGGETVISGCRAIHGGTLLRHSHRRRRGLRKTRR